MDAKIQSDFAGENRMCLSIFHFACVTEMIDCSSNLLLITLSCLFYTNPHVN